MQRKAEQGDSLWIQTIMQTIWKEATVQMAKTAGQLQGWSTQQIVALVREKMANWQEAQRLQEDVVFYNFLDAGCDHCNRAGVFGGCSFCDFLSGRMDLVCLMTLLKQRDEDAFAALLCEEWDRAMASRPKCEAIQFVSGYDTLSPQELPRCFIQKIKETGRKACYNGFDTRADSVTPGALKAWRGVLGRRAGANIGMETANEWIRNHWIHKNTSDQQLTEAAALLKGEGYSMTLSLLASIPGLSDRQSITLLERSVERALQLKPSQIVISPLVDRHYTLQHIIRQSKGKEAQWRRRGLTHGQESEGVALLVLYEGLVRILRTHPELGKRLAVNPVAFPVFFTSVIPALEERNLQQTVYAAASHLDRAAKEQDLSVLLSDQRVRSLEGYRRFEDSLQKQDGVEQLRETMTFVSDQLSDLLCADQAVRMKRQFRRELDTFVL